MRDSGGRHRKTGPARERRLGSHRETSGRSKLPLAGVAAVAVAGAALLGVTPALTAAPTLLAYSAPAYYVRGTNIGYVPPDSSYAAFADNVIDQTAGGHQPAQKIQYPAIFCFMFCRIVGCIMPSVDFAIKVFIVRAFEDSSDNIY